MTMSGRQANPGDYRYGFQGQEGDKEMYGSEGTSIAFKYRVHDARIGRFLSVDPLAPEYPHNSPYAFAENKVIAFIELEGLEISLPRTGYWLPRTISIPRAPSIPIPQPPTIPLPPIALPQPTTTIPAIPTQPQSMSFESDIDWNNPPSSPESLGENWEEIKDPRRPSENRQFRNKNNPDEKLAFDKGKKGANGWRGKDHWHRFNPNSKGKKDMYLDRFGNAVSKGSEASHIGAGESLLQAIPGIIQQYESKLDELQKQRDNLSLWNLDDWDEIKKINNQKESVQDFIDNLEDYKEAWDQYNQDMEEYYENCNCTT